MCNLSVTDSPSTVRWRCRCYNGMPRCSFEDDAVTIELEDSHFWSTGPLRKCAMRLLSLVDGSQALRRADLVDISWRARPRSDVSPNFPSCQCRMLRQ
jgi:hypothetical protein